MRARALLGAIGLAAALPVAGGGLGPCASAARAQGVHRAGLVVQLSATDVRRFCVEFTEESISGLELLQRSGLPVVYSVQSLGAFVCRVAGTGCVARRCACRCPSTGGPCTFWGYYRLRSGRWLFSATGASATPVRDGDVEGWRWGEHRQGTLPPGGATLDGICARGTKVAAAARTRRDVRERQRSNAVAVAVLGVLLAALATLGALAARARRRGAAP